jgi:CheY-like chemotaxis protein
LAAAVTGHSTGLVGPKGDKTIQFELSRFTLTPDMPPSCLEMKPGEWIVLTISDTGMGMPPDVQDHLFEPFLTTKGHYGTGLGLAQVYGIVKQHEGCIEVHSQPGQGTRFVIYLPVATTNQKEEPSPSESLPLGDGETILLVEDEAAVLEVGKIMLEKLGYRVVAVDNARAALTKCESQDNSIALVLTDMVMPGMDGFVLCQAVKTQWP